MMLDLILNFNVTQQDNIYRGNKLVTIGNFLNEIKCMKYLNKIKILRKYISDGNLDKYDQEKIRLPAVTFSGSFANTRRIESLIEYNKICVIDIDKISDQDIKKYFNVLQSDIYVFTYWLSPSGRGIKGLVKFNYLDPFDKLNSNEYHKIAFTILKEYFLEKYNIEIDKSGSDITRLCFISSDSNLVLKNDVNEFHIDSHTVPKYFIKSNKKEGNQVSNNFFLKEHMNPKEKNEQSKRTDIQKIIKYLRKKGCSITSTYDDWYKVAYAISSTFTYDLGEKYYLQLCRLDGNRHREDESKAMLQYCYTNSKKIISFGTIQYLFSKIKEELEGSRTEEVSMNIDP